MFFFLISVAILAGFVAYTTAPKGTRRTVKVPEKKWCHFSCIKYGAEENEIGELHRTWTQSGMYACVGPTHTTLLVSAARGEDIWDVHFHTQYTHLSTIALYMFVLLKQLIYVDSQASN